MLAACRCGTVAIELAGAPILSTACYCTSCQEAGRRIESLPDAQPLRVADGGTPFLLYRKDRVRCLRGGEHLAMHRLTPDSPTRRAVATCCNAAMFLDFTKGHWLSVYRARLPVDAPPLEMRIMTADQPAGVALPDDVPNHAGYPGRFMARLLLAWLAMGFRRPAVKGVPARP